MYLFNDKGSFVEIYFLEPSFKKIKDYKISKMKCDDITKKVLCFKTNDTGINLDVSTLKKQSYIKNVVVDNIDYEKRNTFNRKFHTVMCMDDYMEAYRAINGYFNGDYDDSLILRIFDYKISESEPQSYFLLNEGYVSRDKLKYVNDIINIPESLYLLELIIRQEFSLLNGYDISEQLGLFDFSDEPVGAIDRKTFYDSESGVVKGSKNGITKKMSEHRNFLNRIKK